MTIRLTADGAPDLSAGGYDASRADRIAAKGIRQKVRWLRMKRFKEHDMKPTEMIAEQLTYTVVGLSVTGIDTARLHKRLMRHNTSLVGKPHQQRVLIVLSVDSLSESEDFKALSARFGEQYDHFALLNDVAVDACNTVGFSIKVLGKIDTTELHVTPYTLLKLSYWNEIVPDVE
jgi:hypothetical protein